MGLIASLIAGCGADDAKPLSSSDGEGPFEPGNDGDGSNDGAGDGAGGLPPEHEESLAFEAPQAGKTSVFIPNPTTNRVAVVNAGSFAIETLAAGTAPTYVATVPGQDVAIVLNVGSRDASLLRAVDGKTAAMRLPIGHDANAIAVAPDGRHAVLYFDASRGDRLASSFQDVTVVNFAEGGEAARGVSVGFRPQGVRFSADATTAFVITEDGVSIVDLTAAVEGPTIAKLVSMGDGLSDALSQDIQITPDGSFAFARREGVAAIRRIDLASGAIQNLELSVLQGEAGDAGLASGPLAPEGELELTDLDLAPDGSFLLAVVRNRGALLHIPVPAGFDDPALIEAHLVTDQTVGSVSIAKTGAVAAAYTTTMNTEGLVLVDLAQGAPPRGVRLRKGVRAVAFSDDGTRALVLHSAVAQTSSADEEALIDRSEGYSLVDTTTGFAKLQLTPAPIREADVVVLPDASRMFALLRDDLSGVRALEVADLGSFQISSVSLAKPPSSIGLVPAVDRVFIGQESEGGMITFVDSATGRVAKAVSGFELASRIRQ